MAKQKNAFPPVSREDMRARGIDQLDFIFVSGDAYIDHPSFGAAIITRLLESRGYTVGIIAQPDWHGVEPFRALGKPKLAFLISSGNIDSWSSTIPFPARGGQTTRTRRRRWGGIRPDPRDDRLRKPLQSALFGCADHHRGIEASLRRFAHFDYGTTACGRAYSTTRARISSSMVWERRFVQVADELNGQARFRDHEHSRHMRRLAARTSENA